jgi:hypothetical protein
VQGDWSRRAHAGKPAARTLLTHFLKSRRAALRPADVGLPAGSAFRRTPGLRRAEVALLAGISTEWYTLFEMGQDRAMTQRVIGPVAKALRLREVEREYLYDLVRAEHPPEGNIDLVPALGKMLEDDQKLVIVYDRWLNAVRWNAATTTLVSLDATDPHKANVLWRFFRLPDAHERYPSWEERARFFLGVFRRALGRDPANREARAIINSLQSSDEFRRMWERHEIYSLDEETAILHNALRLRDPEFGELSYFTIGLPIPGSGGAHLRILIPTEDSGRALLREAASRQSLRSA